MAVTEGLIQLPVATAPLGKNTATATKTDGLGNTVEMQQMCLSDPITASNSGGAARVQAGAQMVNSEGQKATYRTAIVGLVTVTGATDVFTLKGSGTKTVRVLRVSVGGTIQTAAQYVDVNLVKRSAADTAGTQTAPALVPLDSADGAATAVANAYTGNPTLGAAVGVIDAQRVFCPITGTPAAGTSQCNFDFGARNGRALVLRGAAEQLCVNLNAPANAGTFDIAIELVEE